jgi:DNA-directed RNA polymerase subunit H (RpoH/RPB5)
MTSQVYPPKVITQTLISEFFPRRGLRHTAQNLEADPPVFDEDRIIGDMEKFHVVRLDAVREVPRGGRDWVVVLVLAAEGKYSQHSPDLRKLLEGVAAERAAKAGRLDEIILVAEEGFFGKKNLTDVVNEFQAGQAGGPDEEGAAPFYTLCHYYNFACVIPDSASVCPHRVLSAEEARAVLEAGRISRADLPVIFTTDAPLVWLGAREGRVVEIVRDSQTAGTSVYYRRVERGAI